MKVRVSTIVSKVFALLDENETIAEELTEYCDPDLMLRPLIADLLPDAARAVILEAPVSALDDCRHLENLALNEEGASELTLPSDFLKLVYVRMSDWTHGISVPLKCDGEEHMLHRNPTMRRRSRPATAVRRRGDICTLEIYGSSPGAAVASLDYAAVPQGGGAFIDLPPSLIPDICQRIASMIKDIMR